MDRSAISGVETESSSDEEHQNITTEQLKMILINVCNVYKAAVLIIDIMLVSSVIFASYYFRNI